VNLFFKDFLVTHICIVTVGFKFPLLFVTTRSSTFIKNLSFGSKF